MHAAPTLGAQLDASCAQSRSQSSSPFADDARRLSAQSADDAPSASNAQALSPPFRVEGSKAAPCQVYDPGCGYAQDYARALDYVPSLGMPCPVPEAGGYACHAPGPEHVELSPQHVGHRPSPPGFPGLGTSCVGGPHPDAHERRSRPTSP
jgi:hypothetical protein